MSHLGKAGVIPQCHFSAGKEYFLSYKTTLGLFFSLKLYTAAKDLE